jgi:hypothetical protein
VRRRDGFIDEQSALDELLTRWNIRLGDSPEHRRIALRMARHDADLSRQAESDADVVAALTSVPHQEAPISGEEPPRRAPEPSDDDDGDIEEDYLDDDLEWA